MISCVRPGVFEVRANAFRPVSALISEDFPALERPAKAISSPFIGGSESMPAAAHRNSQSEANSLRPASISARVKPVAMLLERHSWLRRQDDGVLAFFFPNTSFTLSHNSILAPCFFMMKDCCSTESVLFQAQ